MFATMSLTQLNAVSRFKTLLLRAYGRRSGEKKRHRDQPRNWSVCRSKGGLIKDAIENRSSHAVTTGPNQQSNSGYDSQSETRLRKLTSTEPLPCI